VSPRGWLVAKLAIVALVALDTAARFWLRYVYTVERPRQPQGAFVKAYSIDIDKGATYISNADFMLLSGLEIVGFGLIFAFFLLQFLSHRARRQVRSQS